MTLHELATNAAKYGALSTADGRVKVEWVMLPGRKLHLRWAETGGPATVLPTKKGFGTRAVTRMIGQLGGQITFDWRPDGVRCEITVAT
jgi:two-component sensor histidine kinase